MIKAVMLDWAGTMVDYGCFAPLNVFIEVFRRRGVELTIDEARAPMGLLKKDHIRAILQMPRVADVWEIKQGRRPEEHDVDALYAEFEPMMLETVKDFAEPVPGALDLMAELRERGIKSGSTTGYTAEMMEIVTREAAKRGYAPDSLVTPDEVPAGRPAPYMIYANAIKLGVYPMADIVKVGDTVSDIREGVHAGCWTVGILRGGSELGLSEAEVNGMEQAELNARLAATEARFREAGAHYVAASIADLPDIIDDINLRQTTGDRP